MISRLNFAKNYGKYIIFVSPGGCQDILANKIIKYISSKKINSIDVIIADTLYRHNYAIDRCTKTALINSLDYGSDTVNVWKNEIMNNDKYILYVWNNIINMKSHQKIIKLLDKEYLKNGEFTSIINDYANYSLKRKNIKIRKRSIENNVKYLIEELPTLLFQIPEICSNSYNLNSSSISDHIYIHASAFDVTNDIKIEREKYVSSVKNIDFINNFISENNMIILPKLIDITNSTI